jgi:glycosyltransferase involved in cell wall biosynthesis
MNILYDLIFFEKENYGGISRMWQEIFRLMPQSDLSSTFLTASNTDNLVSNYLEDNTYFGYPRINENMHSNKYLNNIRKLGIYRNYLLYRLIPSETQIFHSTDYINPIVKKNNIKIVTTIHDMVFWDQSSSFNKLNIWYWDKIWSTYHSLVISDRIVTVSETSKKAIVNRYPWSEKKINVIYHGLHASYMGINYFPHKKKYILFMGGRNMYKNYDLLLQSFSKFISIFPDWKLHVTGDNRYTLSKEIEMYKKLGIENHVIDHGFIDEVNLVKLLSKASALVIPSLNEGFNFPMLEAMACGCPVLSSKIPVSIEIGKNYISYFDNNRESLFTELQKCALEPIRQEDLIEAQKYARTFCWQNSFQKLVNVYESCLS